MQTELPALMAEVARRLISQMVPDGSGIDPSEVEAVAGLCMLGVYRKGDEDPRAVLRGVSDSLVLHLVKNLRKARENKALAKVSQFFVIEWCYRNGYMEEDWRWEWTSPNEGQIHYKPAVPLEMIPLPSE